MLVGLTALHQSMRDMSVSHKAPCAGAGHGFIGQQPQP